MNPGDRFNAPNGHAPQEPPPPASGLSRDEVWFTLFRHKWLVLGGVALGLLGAAAVHLVRPPYYLSQAKLMVPYVVATPGTKPPSNADEAVVPTDPGGQDILNSETEILTSLDVAANAASMVGPAKILARFGGGADLMAAAGVVASGVKVENPPQTTILLVSFKHPDPRVVQPVLDALIKTYMRKHLEVRLGVGVLDGYYREKCDALRRKLAGEEEELKRLKTEANLLFPDDTKRTLQAGIAAEQGRLLAMQRDLLAREAAQSSLGPGSTNAEGAAAPADEISDYRTILADLGMAKRREHDLLFERQFTEAHPEVQVARHQLEQLKAKKAQLEGKFPSLAYLGALAASETTNAPGPVDIKLLRAQVLAQSLMVSNVQAEASRILEKEPRITELQRVWEEDKKSYDFMSSRLEETQGGKLQSASPMVNMSVVQNPTPPARDNKKLRKLMGAVFGACAALGVGLAFFIDLVLDRTLRRSVEVERCLRLPVLLTIPDLSRTRRRASSPPPLQAYAEGLRERVLTYFEVNRLNLKKPKLVAVAGCGGGVGVSTLASGLATALSKIGEGNVLLVDMSADQEDSRSFRQGKPRCGLSDALLPEARAVAQVQENLYLASLSHGDKDGLAKLPPTRFLHLVPKLKASDYDYIIFDMPPVSPLSSTPRLASHMDIVLLVVESGKTGQDTASRASGLMREARATVAPVLNRYRPCVPARLAQEW
jgi:uncharacterized protein involved in exopolysaccharide biosynthesis/Mrp family chromosome partitioning ATPase